MPAIGTPSFPIYLDSQKKIRNTHVRYSISQGSTKVRACKGRNGKETSLEIPPLSIRASLQGMIFRKAFESVVRKENPLGIDPYGYLC